MRQDELAACLCKQSLSPGQSSRCMVVKYAEAKRKVYEPTVFENMVSNGLAPLARDRSKGDDRSKRCRWTAWLLNYHCGIQQVRTGRFLQSAQLAERRGVVGQEDFDRLRSLSYADSHVVLLCFSVDQPASLDNVESKVRALSPIQDLWLPLMTLDSGSTRFWNCVPASSSAW